jgi:hypothetical protein
MSDLLYVTGISICVHFPVWYLNETRMLKEKFKTHENLLSILRLCLGAAMTAGAVPPELSRRHLITSRGKISLIKMIFLKSLDQLWYSISGNIIWDAQNSRRHSMGTTRYGFIHWSGAGLEDVAVGYSLDGIVLQPHRDFSHILYWYRSSSCFYIFWAVTLTVGVGRWICIKEKFMPYNINNVLLKANKFVMSLAKWVPDVIKYTDS